MFTRFDFQQLLTHSPYDSIRSSINPHTGIDGRRMQKKASLAARASKSSKSHDAPETADQSSESSERPVGNRSLALECASDTMAVSQFFPPVRTTGEF